MRHWIAGLAACAALTLMGCGSNGAETATVACAQLSGPMADISGNAASVTGAREVAATAKAPAYCEVKGTVAPETDFELRLPLSAFWNQRFLHSGCGGLCGAVDGSRCAEGASRGFATVTQNGGHRSRASDANLASVDGTWGSGPGARTLEVDYGYGAVEKATLAAKAITERHYGRAIRMSYFKGCSKGGNQGLQAALRYPGLFEGIVVESPVHNTNTLGATAFAWTARQAQLRFFGLDQQLLRDVDASLLAGAVRQSCGDAQGLVSDPRTCKFQAASLLCSGSYVAGQCLTAKQVTAVENIYAGPADSSGRALHPGLTRSSEASWAFWVTGAGNRPGQTLLIGTDYLRYLAFDTDPGPAYTVDEFDFDRDAPVVSSNTMNSIMSAESVEMEAFKQRGGKLLIVHGWSDSLATPLKSVEYWKRLVKRFGGDAQTAAAFRTFMVPGLAHCNVFSSDFSVDVDTLKVIVEWREEGRAPESLVASYRSPSTGAALFERSIPRHRD